MPGEERAEELDVGKIVRTERCLRRCIARSERQHAHRAAGTKARRNLAAHAGGARAWRHVVEHLHVVPRLRPRTVGDTGIERVAARDALSDRPQLLRRFVVHAEAAGNRVEDEIRAFDVTERSGKGEPGPHRCSRFAQHRVDQLISA